MKPYILMGYGMMKMAEDLLKDWNGGNIILNPRVLNEEQLISCSQTYKKIMQQYYLIHIVMYQDQINQY